MKKTASDSRGQLDGKLIAYATVTAATLGGASSLDAQITNITISDFGGSLPSISSGGLATYYASTPFTLAEGAFGLNLTLRFYSDGSGFTSQYGRASFNGVGGGNQVVAMHGDLKKLVLNEAITGFGTAGYAFRTNNGSAFANFIPDLDGTVTGYAGFKAGSDYGWLRLQVGRSGAGFPLSIALLADGNGIVGAFGDNTILAGQVAAAIPEPATVGIGLGLLALGAAGVREHRRRKAA